MNPNIEPSIPDRKAQVHILSEKTQSFLRRKWNFYSYHALIIPLTFVWITYINYLVKTQSVLQKESFYAPEPLPQYTKCTSEGCLPLGVVLYSLDKDSAVKPWIRETLKHLRHKLDLQGDGELKVIYNGNSIKEIDKEIAKYPEITNMLYFCNDYVIYKNTTTNISCDQFNTPNFNKIDLNLYGIAYNQTRISSSYIQDMDIPMRVDKNAILLKKTIDEFIINYYREDSGRSWSQRPPGHAFGFASNSSSYIIADEGTSFHNSAKGSKGDARPADSAKTSFAYIIDIMSFMKPKLSFLNRYDSSVASGAFFYIFCILLSFSQYMKIMAQEKGQKLRRGLIPYGLSGLAYWSAWILYALKFNLVVTAMMWAMGYCMAYAMFKEAPFLIVYLLIYVTLMAYSFLAMIIVACCEDFKSANKVTYTFIVMSIFLEMFFSNRGILTLFFVEDKPFMATLLNYLLSVVPSFPFSLITSNIGVSVGYNFSPFTFAFEKGPGYNYTTFITPTYMPSRFTGDIYIPSDLSSFGWLLGSCLFYLIILWICDNYVESNNGFKRPLLSLFKRRMNLADDMSLSEPLVSEQSSSAPLFELREIDKTYKMNFWGTKMVHALHNFNLAIQENEVLALLGENGAGKSTLISIIAGNLKADTGKVYYRGRVFGTSKNDRLLVSVCPQYDLLWTELSVYENMRIIGQFRGMGDAAINKQVDDILIKMDLIDQKQTIVKQLSGGMRRRISVGISLIGNPDLVILDEPTTGLDPVHRKSVWNFIKELKASGKAVLLTTHIMDEADYLADRIAIINKGELLRNNTSVAIKNEFKSFNAIFSIKKYTEAGFELLTQLLYQFYGNTFVLKYKSASLMKFNIPSEDMRTTIEFVRILENLTASDRYSELNEFIDSFEVASLDLEEAYMLINEQHTARMG